MSAEHIFISPSTKSSAVSNCAQIYSSSGHSTGFSIGFRSASWPCRSKALIILLLAWISACCYHAAFMAKFIGIWSYLTHYLDTLALPFLSLLLVLTLPRGTANGLDILPYPRLDRYLSTNEILCVLCNANIGFSSRQENPEDSWDFIQGLSESPMTRTLEFIRT